MFTCQAPSTVLERSINNNQSFGLTCNRVVQACGGERQTSADPTCYCKVHPRKINTRRAISTGQSVPKKSTDLARAQLWVTTRSGWDILPSSALRARTMG